MHVLLSAHCSLATLVGGCLILLSSVRVGHMEKQEMEVEWKLETENGNGNWKRKWKCTNRWHAVLRKTPRTTWRWYCVRRWKKAPNPTPCINLEDWRAVGLAEGCASNPIVITAYCCDCSVMSICFSQTCT